MTPNIPLTNSAFCLSVWNEEVALFEADNGDELREADDGDELLEGATSTLNIRNTIADVICEHLGINTPRVQSVLEVGLRCSEQLYCMGYIRLGLWQHDTDYGVEQDENEDDEPNAPLLPYRAEDEEYIQQVVEMYYRNHGEERI